MQKNMHYLAKIIYVINLIYGVDDTRKESAKLLPFIRKLALFKKFLGLAMVLASNHLTDSMAVEMHVTRIDLSLLTSVPREKWDRRELIVADNAYIIGHDSQILRSVRASRSGHSQFDNRLYPSPPIADPLIKSLPPELNSLFVLALYLAVIARSDSRAFRSTLLIL